MRRHQSGRILSSEITPEAVYLNRRELLAAALAGGALAATSLAALPAHADDAAPRPDPRFSFTRNPRYSVTAAPTAYKDITHYNNFYEFGTSKEDPAENAGALRPRPWSVTVGGECAARGTFAFEDLIKDLPLEERVYRFRCVEAWS